jgi:Ricin-type beta-trefoil lectin domain-like
VVGPPFSRGNPTERFNATINMKMTNSPTAASFIAVVFACFGMAMQTGATTFTIDSLDGDITSNEINQFVSSINSLTPPSNNWGDNMSTHGTAVQGMQRMYEATGNINILNTYIKFMDVALSHRNDQPLGEHRTMWDGTVAPGWPESSTSTTPACTTGQIHGNIAYCALLILETPSIWNNTIPDGNPNGYGSTYKARALTYLSKVDSGLSAYITKWFVDSSTFKIHTPSDSRWSTASGGDTAETAWNRQALFVSAYNYAAQCHDILGDNPSFLPLYKGVVNKFATWFVTGYPSGGSVYYSSGGHNVAKWYYQIPTDQHIENIGHAQHDIVGLFEAYESGYAAVSSSQMKVYADTTQYIINLGSTGSWSLNVDGTGTPSGSLKTDFIFLSQINSALYKMIAQSNIDDNQLNGSEGCKNTGYILYMKHWFASQANIDTSKIYKLQNVASGLVLNNQGSLTNASKITQWSASTISVNLEWKFIPTSNGYYQINSVKSGLDAVVQSASTAAGAGIIQWSFGSAGNDQWKPVKNSDGSYTFYNLHSGLVLEDPGSSTSTSTQMDQWTANGGSNQKWNLVPQ